MNLAIGVSGLSAKVFSAIAAASMATGSTNRATTGGTPASAYHHRINKHVPDKMRYVTGRALIADMICASAEATGISNASGDDPAADKQAELRQLLEVLTTTDMALIVSPS
jgi:hypothetical protein